MKLLMPDNIFAKILANVLDPDIRKNIVFLPSQKVTRNFYTEEADAALVPTLDLIEHDAFIASAKYGIAFEGILSNAYFYFNFSKEDQPLEKIELAGDVSSTEALLTRLTVTERYKVEPEVQLAEGKPEADHLLLAGDANWKNGRFEKGFSFAEMVSDMLRLPFTQYVFAAEDEDNLKALDAYFNESNKRVREALNDLGFLRSIGYDVTEETAAYFFNEIIDVYYEFGEKHIEGAVQLLRFPFLHGLAGEIKEIEFA